MCVYNLLKYTSSPGISTTSGIVIQPSHHWLAASPDDLIHDPISADSLGVVEYINPYKFGYSTLLEAASNVKDFCSANNDGSLSRKRSHVYYYQVQATMFCTQRKWCDFVVMQNFN